MLKTEFKSLFRFILNKKFDLTVSQTFKNLISIKIDYGRNMKFNAYLILITSYSPIFEVSNNSL